jgi:hypothetical protein
MRKAARTPIEMASTPAPTPIPIEAPVDRGGFESPEVLNPMAHATLTTAEVGRAEFLGFAARPAVICGGVALSLKELKHGVW